MADCLLHHLKMEGPRTSTEIGEAMGTTAEAARQQMTKLADEGLVKSECTRPCRPGRPAQLWSLTGAGHARFPDGHAALLVQLLSAARRDRGGGAPAPSIDRALALCEAETRRAYAAAVDRQAPLGERVAELAALRTRDGYMAEWHADGDGYLLVENHCPVGAAAAACRGLCRAELRMLRSVLDADVVRTEYLFEGGRRCAYRVTPKARKRRAARRPRRR